MRRVLITGASGFIGANLARRLLENGDDVYALLRAPEGNWRLGDIESRLASIHGDLTNRESVRTAVRTAKPEIVFHLAAYGAYPSQKGFESMVATNILGSAFLLDACIEAGVACFIQTGSSSEYGYKNHATSETDGLDPNSHYAITKAAATHYCSLAAKTAAIRTATARLYSIYGPYEEPTRLVPALIVHGLKNRLPPLVSPKTARDYVHVDDAVSALLEIAAAQNPPPGAIYNVSSGIQTSLSELVSLARELLGIAAEPHWGAMQPRSWDTETWVGDPAAIQRDIGWKPRTSLRKGLERTIEWFRRNPKLLDYYAARI